jgi:hypothetical protein
MARPVSHQIDHAYAGVCIDEHKQILPCRIGSSSLATAKKVTVYYNSFSEFFQEV